MEQTVVKELSRHILRTVRKQRPILVRNALLHDGAKELLSSRSPIELKWYSCGPTVYDDAHLGHARAYVSFDIIRRIIGSLSGTHVDYALGVTDIDDKILNRAREQNISPVTLATRFEARFFEDMNTLNVLPPTRILRVTEHIRELQLFISELIQSGAAYASEQGNVYFSVKCSGERYGQLDPSRGLPTDDEQSIWTPTERNVSAEKRNPRDFALWKCTDDADADGVWDSPWGRGRPGWHVECSAMAMEAIGPFLDLHTGGIDLRFPHHTNELATAEAKLCRHQIPPTSPDGCERWSHIWLHAGHLHLRGRKMSKSVKNFITIREFCNQGGSADAFRIFCLLHRYSSPVEYSHDRLEEAQSYLTRLRRFTAREPLVELQTSHVGNNGAKRLSMHPACDQAANLHAQVVSTEQAIEDALADDFDTPRAMAKIGRLITSANTSLNREGAWVSGAAALAYESASRVVRNVFNMLGVSSLNHNSQGLSDSDAGRISKDITETYVQFRAGVRDAAKRKDIGALFELCDKARDDAVGDFGIRIADKKDGSSSWSRE